MRLELAKLQLRDHECKLDEYGAISGQLSVLQRIKQRWYNLVLMSDASRVAKQFFRSSAARFSEKERHHMSRNRNIIHPFSNIRIAWQCVMVIVLGVLLVMIPFTHSMYTAGATNRRVPNVLAYYENVRVIAGFYVICWIDIVMNFYTGYHVEAMEIVLDRKKIACRYLKGHFTSDVISSVPLELLFYVTFGTEWEANVFHSWVNVCIVTVAVLKIIRFKTFLDHIEQLAQTFGLHCFVYRTIHIIIVFVILVVWTAGIQFLIPHIIHGDKLMNDNASTYGGSWMHYYRINNVTISRKLRMSVVRVLGQTNTIGTCNQSGTYFIENFLDRPIITLLGRVFNAYVLANVMLMAKSYFDAEYRYSSVMSQLQKFMYHNQLPLWLQRRIQTYYEYRYQRRYFREHSITGAMPELMRRELSMVEHRHHVTNVAIFNKMSRDVIANIVSAMKLEIFLEHDVIIAQGSVGNCMYFLATGSVAVFHSEGDTTARREICHLVDGDHFGETALLSEEPRNASVVALETCEIYRLDREDFNRCIGRNRDLHHLVSQISEMRAPTNPMNNARIGELFRL